MTFPTRRAFPLLTVLLVLAGLWVLSSCTLTGEGQTYMTIRKDTAWSRFDRIEISWLDTVSGEGGLLFNGSPDQLNASNRFEAESYRGQKVRILFKGYIGENLVFEEHRHFDSASPKTVEKVIVPLLPPGAKESPPRLSPIQTDTLVSIHDSVRFTANAQLTAGQLKGHIWDYDGDGNSEDSAAATGSAAVLLGGYRYAKAGIFTVVLKAYAASDSMAETSVQVRVSQDMPTADAGADQTVYTGDTVELEGTGNDGLGRVERMEWQIGEGAFAVSQGKTGFRAPQEPGDVVARFRVTDDDSQSTVDEVMVHVVSRNEANLTGIGVSSGKLSPAFNPSVTKYQDTVGYEVESITVTPAGNGTLTVQGAEVESGKPSGAIALPVGKTTVIVEVKLGEFPAKTYQVEVVRRAASLDANLSGLASSAGTLSPSFSPVDTVYGISTSLTAATVTATLADSSSSLLINGSKATSGQASTSISLKVGSNPVTIEVTSQGGAKKIYSINIVRAGDGNADLARLSASAGAIQPAFSAGTFEYGMTVGDSVSTFDVTAEAVRSTSTMTINGQNVLSGSPHAVSLVVGANPILIELTAENGSRKSYTLRVTRTGNGNADLSGLALSAGAIVSAFTPEAVFYTLDVAHPVESTTVLATTAKESSSLAINGQPATSGKAYPVALAVGGNPITVTVTAQSGDKKSYTVIVTRAKNANAELKGLVLSAGSFSPAFGAGVLNYSLSVDNAVSTTTVQPEATASTSGITVNGVEVASGDSSAAIGLSVGSNPIAVVVTAQSGATRTYTVTVNRAPNDDTTLSALTLAAGALTPVFTPANSAYSLAVANNVASTTVTPTVGGFTSSVKVNGTTVPSGAASSPISLNVGANTISIQVTAQNLAVKTYTVTANRSANGNADLSALSVSAGTFTPTFAAGTTAYALSVANSVLSTTVTPTVAIATSTVKVNGTAVASGAASSSLSLNTGANTLTVVVTAQDNSTKTYTITVTRAPDANANLSALALSAGTLAPAFAAATTSYTLSVPNSTASTTVTPTLAAGTSTVRVNGTLVTSGSASASLPLSVGANTITVLVTAQDNSTRTYTVTVTRSANANADLGALALSAGSLSPAFSAGTTAYAVTAPHAASTTTVTPTAAAGVSVVRVNGSVVASGSASSPIALAVGMTAITIGITAESGATRSYTVQVTRVPGYKIGTGLFTSMFIRSDNSLTTAGWNQFGSVGDGTDVNRPTAVPVMSGVAEASGGHYHTLMLKTDGTAWATGGNFFGAFGDGTNSGTLTPHKVISGVSALGAGYGHSIFLKTDGTVWTTGFNSSGQLGVGDTDFRNVPLQVLNNTTRITGGSSFSFALRTDATLWATGNNSAGQLGDASLENFLTFRQIMSDVATMAAGVQHTLVVKRDGTLWAMGSNSDGQLGDGTTVDKSSPVQVMSDVSSVAAGYYFSLILKRDGTLWTMGINAYGQLGDGTTTSRSTPVQVMSGVHAISAGGEFAVVVRKDGTAWSMGSNNYGQLGDGTTTDRASPVQISP